MAKGRNLPKAFAWTGSVIPKVFLPALACTLFAVLITCLDELTAVKISLPQIFITVFGFVVGLLLTYRTNTAYDRYWEGRRTWSTMNIAIRTLTRLVWVNVKETETSHIVEKKTVINLLEGFVVATKHYLRGEDGVEWDDLKHLISSIKSRLPSFGQELGKEPRQSSELEERHKFEPRQRPKGSPASHNLPLEITLYLTSYARAVHARYKDITTTTGLLTGINTLVDCLTTFERILRTPIPLAYSIHLSQTVRIYCFTLPIQFVSLLGWTTIPVVFICTIVLLGIEKIGEEIENPFGYDANDLDLDDFCSTVSRELRGITATPSPSIDDWALVDKGKQAAV